jgi:hypothetical protein
MKHVAAASVIQHHASVTRAIQFHLRCIQHQQNTCLSGIMLDRDHAC